MPKIYLTDNLVFEALCPAGKDQEIYWDYPVGADGRIRNGSVSGLGLRVTTLGAKSFVHAYQFNGKRCRKVLGTTVALDVGSARLSVRNREQQLEAGENPDLDSTNPRRAHLLTVREAIDRYWESHVSSLSEGYRDNFAVFVAQWRRRTPKMASRRGHNVRRRYVSAVSAPLDWVYFEACCVCEKVSRIIWRFAWQKMDLLGATKLSSRVAETGVGQMMSRAGL